MTQIELSENCKFDLERLLETRLLIQANSGGGKSYCIRKLLEETHGKVQHIILDLEGEFSTLREKYDYLLVGKDGDIKLDIRSSEILANKLLELNVSTIIDLYELKHHERILFVKKFLDAMINAPKELWHPCMIIIDEAHQFCPEKNQAESSSAVIDIMTRGRKRGFCGVLATQRLSKLHKDAAAEANNKLIGRTGLDVDMKRAGEELGFTSKADILSLRDLKAGEFFAFGTATSNKVIKVKIGKVKTSHPKLGYKMKEITPPTNNIKKMLEKLTDLPQKAEEELREKTDFIKKIRELERQLREMPKTQLNEAELEKKLIIVEKRLALSFEKEYQNRITQYERNQKLLQSKLESIGKIIGQEVKIQRIEPIKLNVDKSRLAIPKHEYPKQIVQSTPLGDVEPQLDKCAKMIYSLLASNPTREFSKSLVGVLTGYSHTSGGFNNSCAKLNSLGLITRGNNTIKANPNDIKEELIDTSQAWDVKSWVDKLGKCPKEIFALIIDNPDEEFTKEEIGDKTGYSPSSGGFNNSIARLNSLGLIKRLPDSRIKLNEEILEFL